MHITKKQIQKERRFMMPLDWPYSDKKLRIGIIGMTEGNGHPYSWSAIFNDYDKVKMLQCPFPGIPEYLNKQPKDTIGIKGTKITHIYCNDLKDSQAVAEASFIDNVVEEPEQMIGEVDAVIFATDVGSEHVERCRPFIEANIPMFIDKPMVDNLKDLKQFVEWREKGAHFISSSSMRYQKEMEIYYNNFHEFGKLMYICRPMCKKWETYGIHALENIYPLLGPGFISIQNTGDYNRNMVHIKHETGCDVHIPLTKTMFGAFQQSLLVGSLGSVSVENNDPYYSFKKQLVEFVQYLRTGFEPFPFEETIELMKLVIGGIISRDEHGRVVQLEELEV